MPQHYKVEALRAIRSLQAAYEKGNRTAQAEQMRAVGDQVETMVKALEAIASLYWKDAPAPEEMREMARNALRGDE